MNGLVTFAKNVSLMFGKKRGRRPVFNSNMFYPHVAERELQGATREEFLRFIAEALAVAEIGTQFADDISELSDFDPKLPEDFVAEISKVSKEIEKKAMSSFSRQSEMIIGKPYYPPEVKGEILTNWESNFQMLCKSAETDAKKDIARLVQQGKNEGWNKLQLEKAVKSQLPGKYKNRAELIARTETAKLNTQINLETYRNIGIEYYTWMTTIDGRERESHAAMNGVICSVSDPDVYFEENPEDPLHPIQHARTGEMVHMHPGEDFQCRCSMVAWDPYINGSYEVKEAPQSAEELAREEVEKAQTPLEVAKEETAKAEKRAENAEIKLKTEQRRREILQNANERHQKRTVADREKIQAKWTVSHPHSQMPDKFESVDDIAEFWNKIDKSREVLGQERILKNGEFRFGGIDSSHNGSTMMDGSIKLNSKISKKCVSAFEKIRLRESLTEDEAISMATLWHEMTHNRHKRTSWIEIATSSKETKYMEMANELVARNTLGEFYRMLGLKENPVKSLEKFRENTAYNPWVVGLQATSEIFGIDRNTFIKEVADGLFNKAYNNQRNSLVQVLVNNVKGMNELEAKKIVDYCISIKPYEFKNGLFMTKDYVDIGAEINNNLLLGIKESIEKRKKKK